MDSYALLVRKRRSSAGRPLTQFSRNPVVSLGPQPRHVNVGYCVRARMAPLHVQRNYYYFGSASRDCPTSRQSLDCVYVRILECTWRMTSGGGPAGTQNYAIYHRLKEKLFYSSIFVFEKSPLCFYPPCFDSFISLDVDRQTCLDFHLFYPVTSFGR